VLHGDRRICWPETFSIKVRNDGFLQAGNYSLRDGSGIVSCGPVASNDPS
jgi:hypothetical protein